MKTRANTNYYCRTLELILTEILLVGAKTVRITLDAEQYIKILITSDIKTLSNQRYIFHTHKPIYKGIPSFKILGNISAKSWI